jgi:hypothetical protein
MVEVAILIDYVKTGIRLQAVDNATCGQTNELEMKNLKLLPE